MGNAQPPPTPASASQPENRIESCALDPKQFTALAARRGFGSTAISTKGGGTCSIDEANVILVVSATSTEDSICEFQLFAPPTQRTHSIVRVGLKAGPGTNPRFIQRVEKGKPLAFSLAAKMGETKQFRIVNIDVEPIANRCPETVAEGALQ